MAEFSSLGNAPVRLAANRQATATMLPLVAAGGTAIYGWLAVAHVFVIEAPDVRMAMVVTAGVTSVLMAACTVVLRTWSELDWRQLVVAWVLALLVIVNCNLHLYLSQDPKQSVNAMLALIGIGCFLSSRRDWIGLTTIHVVAWILSGPLHTPSDQWTHYFFCMSLATGLSALVFWTRRLYFHRLDVSTEALANKNKELLESLGQLEENERRYRESQHVARLGSWQVTFADGQAKLWWSEEVYRLFGLPPTAPVPSREEHLAQIHPQDRELWLTRIRTAQKTGQPFDFEFRNLLPSGDSLTLRARGECRRDAAGQLVQMRGTVHDVTEVHRSEHALQESEEKTKAIVHALPDAMLIFDSEGRCIECHGANSGIVHECVEGERLAKIFPVTAVDAIQAAIEVATAEPHAAPQILEYSMPLPADLEYFEARVVHGGEGRALAILRNITKRKRSACILDCERRALQALAIGKNRHETLAEIARAMEDIGTGARCSILLLDESRKRLHFGAGPSLPERYNTAVDGIEIGPTVGSCGAAACKGEIVIVEDITSHPYWAPFRDLALPHNLRACWSVPVKDSCGEVLGTFAVYYDSPRGPTQFELQVSEFVAPFVAFILERFQAKEALRSSEERLRQLVETTQVVPWEAAGDERSLTYVGPQIAKWLGYTPQQWLSENFWVDHIHPQDRELALSLGADHIEQGSNFQHDYRLLAKDGNYVWVRDIVSVVRQNDQVILRGFYLDITVQKQSEQERADWADQLRETQKLESLGVLAGGIAHDFNNLLTGVLGHANLARLTVDPDSRAQESLAQIESSAIRAAELCKQMLAYAGRGRFIVDPVDLSQLVEETTHLLSLTISKKASLEFQLDPDVPPVLADATQMRQIVMNLVMNASEALGDASGTIRVTTGTVQADRTFLAEAHLASDLDPGPYVFVEVSDSGCGMNDTILTKAFDPFFTTKFTGRGLGLAAVLGIVRSHQGALRVRSEPGHGSQFRVLLPPCAPPTSQRKAPPQNTPAVTLARSTGRALIVDDEAVVRRIVSQILDRLGFDVVQAVDGQDALDKVTSAKEPFAVVLLDLTMPNLDGEQTYDRLQELAPHLPVILMSGFTEQETSHRFAGKPIAGFLQKPFRMEAVQERIEAALQQPPARLRRPA